MSRAIPLLWAALLLVNGCTSEPATVAEPTRSPARTPSTAAPSTTTPPSPADPVLDRAGRAFVAFARGGELDPRLAGHDVDLYLGGRFVHSIPARRAVHRTSYDRICPGSRGYAGYVCPFSMVRPLARHPGPIGVTSDPPAHPCMHARTFAGTREHTVTLTPAGDLYCTTYFAVELAVDDEGSLLAVNLVMAEP